MDGRISVSLCLFALTLSSAGCLSPQNKKDVISVPTPPSPEEQAMVKKQDGPKRNPMPATEVAYGQMKEKEADSDSAKKDAEVQARLRDEARQAYQHAIKLDPNCADGYRFLARVYSKSGDYERAFDTYRKAMAKHPKDASLWYELGQCHNRRKDFNESVRCFKKALEFDPENREYLKTLGFTLAYEGQIDEGLKNLTRVHGAALAHYNVARILLQKDRPDEARKHLRLAVQADSHLEPARELLTSLEPTPTASAQSSPPQGRTTTP